LLRSYAVYAVELNLQILQGSASSTDLVQGGRFYSSYFHSSSINATVKALSKSVQICHSYCKNKMGHTVEQHQYIIITIFCLWFHKEKCNKCKT